jgi:hypothetical protein
MSSTGAFLVKADFSPAMVSKETSNTYLNPDRFSRYPIER